MHKAQFQLYAVLPRSALGHGDGLIQDASQPSFFFSPIPIFVISIQLPELFQSAVFIFIPIFVDKLNCNQKHTLFQLKPTLAAVDLTALDAR